jgi:cyanophycin synthetase
MLNRMRRWGRIEWYLESQGKTFKDIPEKGEKVIVYPLPNFSTGGSVKTIPLESIHPSLIKLAEKAAQALGLVICGVDILIKDLKKPVSSRNSVIIELNSDPGIRLHEWPNEGRSQPVTTKILHFIAKKHSSYSSDLS